ncbi:MAG: hypothetical protein PHE48_03755 [Candidatus Daviesbacteria bacterium]|nr:hypothetical protein [Candidatus Daviesbacteria bacterium]
MRVDARTTPFNFRDFANALHELGIGITGSLMRDGSGRVIAFQPKPYEGDFRDGTTGDVFLDLIIETERAANCLFGQEWRNTFGGL